MCACVCAQGIDLVSDLSAEQVEALAGGPALQAEVIPAGAGAVQASAKALQRTVQRLTQALQHVCASSHFHASSCTSCSIHRHLQL
jgi:hypothetical protein